MEELTLDNILSQEEIDNIFLEEDSKETKENANDNNKDNEGKETTEAEINIEDLFESESVSSGKEENKGQEDTSKQNSGISPNNMYSSIATALKEDGIFQNLDDETASKITDAESFAKAIRDEVTAQFDERQKRIDAALGVGVEPSEIQKYEGTLNYLNSIKDSDITNESEEGELLRKKLIYNDFINRGYSKERAQREVKKSFDAGTDIEDAKESLKSNIDFYESSYNNIIEEAKKEDEAEIEKNKKEAETLKKDILENNKVFEEFNLDRATRQKIFDSISKPVYKDPKTGELFTAVQKYELENRTEFLKNLGLIYTLTDGFTNFNKLVKIQVKKEMKKEVSALEKVINNTSRASDGSLRFASNVNEDPDSYIGKGWKLDI